MPVSGDRPAALDSRDAPGCPPRARFFLDPGVGYELAVDGVREAPPQAPHGFHRGFPAARLRR